MKRKLITIILLIISLIMICVGAILNIFNLDLILFSKFSENLYDRKFNINLNLGEVTDNDSVELCITKLEDVCFLLEVAKSKEKKQIGLMFKKNLDKNQGMLFIFDKPDIQNFWMKNTLIPLDIIFLDENLNIINIEKAKNINQTQDLYSSIKPSMFVIELNLYTTEKYKIVPTDSFWLKKIYRNTKII